MNAITKEYSIENKFKILGFNDDECTCHVCGKQELKGTYVIENLSSGEIFRAGSVCGSKMAGWTSKELVAKYKTGEKEKLTAAKKELRESIEYINYDNALSFLDKESDNLNALIYSESNQEKRAELSNSRRTLESRLNYLRPFGELLESKRLSIIKKFGYKKGFYLS